MGYALCRQPPTLHSRIADFRLCCIRIVAFFGTPTCHLRIFGFFWTLGSITKDTSRPSHGFFFLVDFVVHGCYLAAWCLYFGVLGESGKILGRPWDDPGTWEGTRKDPTRSRLGFYWVFDDLGDSFWDFFGHFWIKKTFLHIYVEVVFSDSFGFEIGWLGVQKQVSGIEDIAKSNFCRNWISNDTWVISYDFGWPWD